MLSLVHAGPKYGAKIHAESEVAVGFYGSKAHADAIDLRLPSVKELRAFTSDDAFDIADPISRPLIYAAPA